MVWVKCKNAGYLSVFKSLLESLMWVSHLCRAIWRTTTTLVTHCLLVGACNALVTSFQLSLRPCCAYATCLGPLHAVIAYQFAALHAGMQFCIACKRLLPCSCLPADVLELRRGIPISLALVHLVVARRAGLAVQMVGAPMRVVNR